MATDNGEPSAVKLSRVPPTTGNLRLGLASTWLPAVSSRLPVTNSDPKGPRRTPPSQSPSDAVERLVSRRQLRLLAGDVVVLREPFTPVRPRPVSDNAQWRYRVYLHDTPQEAQTFTTFLHAVTRAEDIAASLRARIMLVEDDLPALLADYRRQT